MAATKLTLAPVKQTEGTIVFSEVIDTADPLAVPRLRNLYFPKPLLAQMGWKGNRLNVSIDLGEVAGS